MKIIIGLGNPGKKYELTRHNLGFIFLDFLRKHWDFSEFKDELKLKSAISKKNDIILLKPQTFMNLSGEAVKNVLNFYKKTPADIIVIHDDIDINVGKYKTTINSSPAGHNGIKDIIEKTGTQEFQRFRVGIKNDTLKNPINPSDFVLQKFNEADLALIQENFEEISNRIKDTTIDFNKKS